MNMTLREQDRQAIEAGVMAYCRAVHTQAEEDFLPLWSEKAEAVLISGGKYFQGARSIYNDFLVGLIQARYSRIDLIASEVDVRPLNESAAAVVFAYRTECTLRETGEPFGIHGLETQIWIREGDTWKLCHIQYASV